MFKMITYLYISKYFQNMKTFEKMKYFYVGFGTLKQISALFFKFQGEMNGKTIKCSLCMSFGGRVL